MIEFDTVKDLATGSIIAVDVIRTQGKSVRIYPSEFETVVDKLLHAKWLIEHQSGKPVVDVYTNRFKLSGKE